MSKEGRVNRFWALLGLKVTGVQGNRKTGAMWTAEGLKMR